jgi:hypothetical protein
MLMTAALAAAIAVAAHYRDEALHRSTSPLPPHGALAGQVTVFVAQSPLPPLGALTGQVTVFVAQYSAGRPPHDLLGIALGARPDRVRAIVSRWRRAGLAATGRIGPGPGWAWLTRAGMHATGLRYQARPPSLARLAHICAVLVIRLALQVGDPTGRRGGAASGTSAPGRAGRGRGTCLTPKCTGRPCPPAPTRTSAGRSRPS